jgi:hypothetical protein
MAAPQTFEFSSCFTPVQGVILARGNNLVYLHRGAEWLLCVPKGSNRLVNKTSSKAKQRKTYPAQCKYGRSDRCDGRQGGNRFD